MEKLELSVNPFFLLKLVGISATFLAVGCLPLLVPSVFPLAFGLFTLPGALLGTWGLVRSIRYMRSPVLTLNDSGLTASFTPFGQIPWQEITDIGVRGQGIVISVKRSWEYYIGMSLLRRCANTPTMALPGDLIAIPHGLTKLTTDELFATLTAYAEKSDQQQDSST